ncbi:hypothetical protein BABINDRAFT_33635 [Babjeviella inositovora NRRL Y-12698]|uniref:t-SNARE coiled-coil homology domain-containing protein n=1 Tax=Babjeviella inositovora NRRL Y-12698 TaxID=984486 RepID=A0A1E3QTR0_9ASCO|nr:uncharacterized protein BABINDRAFT_33635 [Babjeviella inositovora NRRL Y-12698]ODQ81059.1 hypothetical protein BABINDRAFT_33635 [Babjeviella inositovora NRRL Y-12698]
MKDLTPLFTQCVRICEKELTLQQPKPHKHATIADTFMKECHELHTSIGVLGRFLGEIRTAYLLSSSNRKDALSDQQKNEIDEETSAQLQQFVQKLKFLEKYEKKRQEVGHKAAGGFWESLDGPSVYETTVNTFRSNVLVYLSQLLQTVSVTLTALQSKRLQRQKEISMSDYQNIEEFRPLRATSPDQLSYDDNAAYQAIQAELAAPSNQVLLQLESENKQLLSQKTNDLQKIHKIESSITDIISLQNDLNLTLSAQTQTINTLIENQEEMEVNMSLGNKNLKKAGGRNSLTSRIIILMCIVLGSFLLAMDYMLS